MLSNILERIEERLTATGLTAAAASARAGLSEDAIRNIRRAADKENAGVSTHTLARLAPVLQTTASWLLEGDDHPAPPEYAARLLLQNDNSDELTNILCEIFYVLQEVEVELDKKFSTKQFARFSSKLLNEYATSGTMPRDIDSVKLISIVLDNA